ncbi:MAG TPA: hypothetical protein VFD58_00860 [Blastocatellia bacterium]|nr:hypothetical protein [Blastocatellia bacterium]
MSTDHGPRYHVGLDLGQSKDFTALCVVECHGKKDKAVFLVRHLKRYELGTSYPAIVADVVALLGRLPAQNRKPRLSVDGTGVGAAVVDLFRQQRIPGLRPVIITGGDQVNEEGGVSRVPKRDLVGVIQVALQTGRLKIAAELPEAPLLVSELQNFQVKITTSANDTYGAWREGAHDDLVLAAALAVWDALNIVEITVVQWVL